MWSSNKVNQVIDPNKKIMLNVKKLGNSKVGLVMSQDIYSTLPNNKDKHGTVIDDEFRLDLNDESLYITGRFDSKTIMGDGNICLSINSVGALDSKEVYGDDKPEEMEKLLLSSKIIDLDVKQHATGTSQSLNA